MPLINRPIVSSIQTQLEKGNVVILIGARQVGKTSLLKLFLNQTKERSPSGTFFYFDLEKEELLEVFESYRSFLQWLRLQGADLNKELYLFIDEFHYMTNPTKLFKILHDDFPNFKIVATGSSSLEISHKIEEPLTGRKRIFHVHSLSFEEFLEFKKSPQKPIFSRLKSDVKIELVGPILSDLVREWEEFLLFGGYPKVTLTSAVEEKVKELEEIYHSYVQKDIKAYLKIENVPAFNKLVKLMAVQIGNLVNFNQLGAPLQIARETLERYVFILENTFIVKIVPPFFTNRNKEIIKMPKVYFYDTGLRNFSIKDLNPLDLRLDTGALVENAVLLEWIRSSTALQDLYFWRTQSGAEVDFVLKDKNGLIPMEVKYQPFSSGKIPTSMKAFIETYHPQSAYVFTKEFSGRTQYQNCQIEFLPAFLSSRVFSLPLVVA